MEEPDHRLRSAGLSLAACGLMIAAVLLVAERGSAPASAPRARQPEALACLGAAEPAPALL